MNMLTVIFVFLLLSVSRLGKTAPEQTPDSSADAVIPEEGKLQTEKFSEMKCSTPGLTETLAAFFDKALKAPSAVPSEQLRLSASIRTENIIVHCGTDGKLYSLEFDGKSTIVTAEGAYSGRCEWRMFKQSYSFADKNKFKFSFALRRKFNFANGNVAMLLQPGFDDSEMTMVKEDNSDRPYICKAHREGVQFNHMKWRVGLLANYEVGTLLFDAVLKRETPCGKEVEVIKGDMFKQIRDALASDRKFNITESDYPFEAQLTGANFESTDLDIACNGFPRIEFIRMLKPLKISVKGGHPQRCSGPSHWKKLQIGMEFSTLLNLRRMFQKEKGSGFLTGGGYYPNWFRAWDYHLTGEMAAIKKCMWAGDIDYYGEMLTTSLSKALGRRLSFLSNYATPPKATKDQVSC